LKKQIFFSTDTNAASMQGSQQIFFRLALRPSHLCVFALKKGFTQWA